MDSKQITARDIERLIAERHVTADKPREWALFFKLRNTTGHGDDGLRYVDAFAMNLYPSKKHWRVAYEIKVSRSDFLAELATPEKRAFAMEISNEFWFACAPGVADPAEIPAGCGLLVPRGNTLKRVVAAKQRQARDLTISEVAAIARKSAHHETYRDIKWQYAGTELDEAALDELVRRQHDARQEAACQQRADARVASKIDYIAQAVLRVKNAMEAVGLAPMPWMESVIRSADEPDAAYFNNLYLFSEKQAQAWVAEHVFPGPNAGDVAKILDEHRQLQLQVRRLLRQMGDTGKHLTDRLSAAEGSLISALRARQDGADRCAATAHGEKVL